MAPQPQQLVLDEEELFTLTNIIDGVPSNASDVVTPGITQEEIESNTTRTQYKKVRVYISNLYSTPFLPL